MNSFNVTINGLVRFAMDGETKEQIMGQLHAAPVLYVDTPASGMLRVNMDQVSTVQVEEI
jgi:hypothetical protein